MIQIKSGRKIWFLVFFGMVVVFAVVFVVMVRPVQKRTTKKLYLYKMKLKTLERITSSPEKVPSEMLFKEIQRETELLKGIYNKAVKQLGLEKPELLPGNVARPSIHWLHALRKTRMDIGRRARESGMEIPEKLAFGDNVPDDSEVPALLEKLKITDELMSIAIGSGVKTVSDIKWGENEIIETSGKYFLKKMYIGISLAGTIESMVKFISSLNKADSFYAIENLDVDASGEIVKAMILLSTARFPRPEDISRATEKAVPYPGAGIEKTGMPPQYRGLSEEEPETSPRPYLGREK